MAFLTGRAPFPTGDADAAAPGSERKRCPSLGHLFTPAWHGWCAPPRRRRSGRLRSAASPRASDAGPSLLVVAPLLLVGADAITFLLSRSVGYRPAQPQY